MRGRLLLALVAGTLVAAVAWWRRSEPIPLRLPERLVVEDEIAGFAPEGAQVGPIRPGDPLRGAGPRRALLAPPGTRLVWRVAVPSDAVLYLSLGVEGPGRRDPDLGGIRFAVRVDGRQMFTRVVNPAATRRDRRWFAERVELPAATGDGPRELEFSTEAVDPSRPPAGTPGWNQVRLVRETSRERQQARPDAPSVIVVLVDTLRADRLGCYGAPETPSPTLDALAAKGVLFEHAVAQSSWTMPSVASLMSGLHPRSHGAWGSRTNRDQDDATGQLLAHAANTWAEAAAHAGITTIGVSANPLVSRETNLAQGFETFVELPWDAEGRNWAPASAVNDAFLRWLAANPGVRFAAHLQYMEPHDPYTPANAPPAGAGVRAPIAAGWVRDLANQVNWRTAPPLPAAEIAHLRTLYDAEIRTWDAELARLLAGLDTLGVRGSTLVVVTADHGEEFQEHGRLTHGSHLYEETVHVPLVVAGPGIRPARRADLAQGIDLFPTLAARLGLPLPPGLPGRDLLAGGAAGPVFSETVRGIAPDGSRIELLAARRGRWKLVRTPALDRTELYDLAEDPGEQQNRWGEAPEGAELAALLAAFQASAAPAPPADGGDPAFHEKLRALGYAQ
jgi:arylsulfatase A-like enzyme